MLSETKSRSAGKTLIFIAIVFTALLAAGCRPTLNVTETNEEQIEEKLIDYEQDEVIGVEIEVSIKDGEEISGELLSVRDSTIIICTEYSAAEEDLASLQYPINTVRTDEIVELKIEGNTTPVLIGAGIGLAVGIGLVVLAGPYNPKPSDTEEASKTCGGILLGLGAFSLGGLIGALVSTEDVILTEIPPGYQFVPLKTLARYPDEEPEYLKALE